MLLVFARAYDYVYALLKYARFEDTPRYKL